MYNQLHVTKEAVLSIGLLTICSDLNTINSADLSKQITISCPFDSPEINLKLALVNRIHVKPQKLWLFCTQSQYCGNATFNLNSYSHSYSYKGIFVLVDQCQQMSISSHNIFAVRDHHEVFQVINMSKAELEIKIKFESILNASRQKYLTNQSRSKMFQFSSLLLASKIRKQIETMKKMMTYYQRGRLRAMRKFFNQWVITHYSVQIEKKEEEIISGKYLQDKSERELLRRCFRILKMERQQNQKQKSIG